MNGAEAIAAVQLESGKYAMWKGKNLQGCSKCVFGTDQEDTCSSRDPVKDMCNSLRSLHNYNANGNYYEWKAI